MSLESSKKDGMIEATLLPILGSLEIPHLFDYDRSITNMLKVQDRPQFVSRIFTDASGRQFQLTFLVAVVHGELRGRLISAEPLAQAHLSGRVSDSDDSVLYLPISCTQNEACTEYISPFKEVISPYFSLEFLITSQPTRAPSCK